MAIQNILDRVAPLATKLADSLDELVTSSFGSVKENQHNFAMGLFAGTVKNQDEDGKPLVHNQWIDGILAMTPAKRRKAIAKDRVVEQAYTGLNATIQLMLGKGDFTEKRKEVLTKQGNSMRKPLLNIAQVLAFGSAQDAKAIEEAFNCGSKDDSDPTFSNLANVAKAIKHNMVANSTVSISRKVDNITVIYSASHLRDLYSKKDRKLSEIEALNKEIGKCESGLVKAWNEKDDHNVILNAKTMQARLIDDIKNLSEAELVEAMNERNKVNSEVA